MHLKSAVLSTYLLHFQCPFHANFLFLLESRLPPKLVIPYPQRLSLFANCLYLNLHTTAGSYTRPNCRLRVSPFQHIHSTWLSTSVSPLYPQSRNTLSSTHACHQHKNPYLYIRFLSPIVIPSSSHQSNPLQPPLHIPLPRSVI